jgi:hypothetical protein
MSPLTVRPPFPRAIDSTMMKTARGCHRKVYLEYFLHWKTLYPSVHLHAGAAFAEGLEAARRAFYEQGKPHEECVGIGIEALLRKYGDFAYPEDTAKTPIRMAGALEYYFTAYPMSTDMIKPYEWSPGKKAIEFSFATPLPVDHPETGEPLIYSGRSDMIGNMAGGLFIEDDKTASQLGGAWINQWDLRSQFTGYCWSAHQSGLKVDGVLVRGVSILKTKYDTAQVITYRRKWEMDRWLEQTTRDLHRLIAAWKEGYYDYNLDEECNAYGGCLFKRLCMSETPESWLEGYYEQRVWDPLTHTETRLAGQGG